MAVLGCFLGGIYDDIALASFVIADAAKKENNKI